MEAYLDNSATTQPCPQAVEAAAQAMGALYYNPSAAYDRALGVLNRMEETRKRVRQALGVKDGSVVFTSGGTESDHMAIHGAMLRRGAVRCAVSAVEHPAVRENAQRFDCTLLNVDERCGIVLDDFEAFLRQTPDLTLLSVMQVNNETGAVMPVAQMARLVKQHTGALVHVDGVQGFLHQAPLDMRDIDLYTLNGHKIHALKGVGVLWVREGVRLAPVSFGGGQEAGLRNGTENTPGIFSLGAAIAAHEPEADLQRMQRLKLRLYEGLKNLPVRVRLNGPEPEQGAPHILNVSFDGVLAEVLLHALERDCVYVSTGSACAARQSHPSPVLSAMGLSRDRIRSAVRFSLSRYTTEEQIDYALEQIKKQVSILARFQRR